MMNVGVPVWVRQCGNKHTRGVLQINHSENVAVVTLFEEFPVFVVDEIRQDIEDAVSRMKPW